MLKELSEEIKKVLLGEVKDILLQARNRDIIVVEEKTDGDSATTADIEVGNLLSAFLSNLLPASIVIDEENFRPCVFEKIKANPEGYIWVVDPIDGTKAFRTAGNNNYCVGVCLLEGLRPVLSLLYAPEYDGGLLFEATEEDNRVFLNNKDLSVSPNLDMSKIFCINHIHRDTKTNATEDIMQRLFPTHSTIRAYEGHSTLLNYGLVAGSGLTRVFSRRGANLWDVVQGAYFVEKLGGSVFYENGESIFPLDLKKLSVTAENKLVLPFNIASNKDTKEIICRAIDSVKAQKHIQSKNYSRD